MRKKAVYDREMDNMTKYLFSMRAYFDESMNIGLAMAAVSLAVIGFSDKFASKFYLQTAGFLLLLTSLGISLTISIDFIKFIKDVRDEDLPPFTTKTRLFVYVSLCYVFFVLMIFISLLFGYRKVFWRVEGQ